MLEISDVLYADPQDHLANMAFARRMMNHCAAIELEQVAAYTKSNTGEIFPYLEISTHLNISDRAAQRRMDFAITLTERLPHTLATFKQGKIEEYKAQLICEAVTILSDEHAQAVEALVLDKAAEQTPNQLRYALTKAVLRVDPEGAEQRRAFRRSRARHPNQTTGLPRNRPSRKGTSRVQGAGYRHASEGCRHRWGSGCGRSCRHTAARRSCR